MRLLMERMTRIIEDVRPLLKKDTNVKNGLVNFRKFTRQNHNPIKITAEILMVIKLFGVTRQIQRFD